MNKLKLSKEEKEQIRDRIDELKYLQNRLTQTLILVIAMMIPLVIFLATDVVNIDKTKILENQTKIILGLVGLVLSFVILSWIINKLGSKQKSIDIALKKNYDLILDRERK